MIDQINALTAEINSLTASDAQTAEALRIKYLGKKGVITALFNEFKELDSDSKRTSASLLTS